MSVINDVWAFLGDLGTKPTAEKIAEGFVRGDKATFQLFNWLFNRHETKINLIGNSGFANVITSIAAPASLEPKAIIHHPFLGGWTYYDETYRYVMLEGKIPSFPIAHGGNSYTLTAVTAVTPTRLVAALASGLTTSWLDWTGGTSTSMTIPLIFSIGSKFINSGTDEALMIGGASGATEYSADGATSWAVPSVPIGGSDSVKSIIWTGTNTFKALAGLKIHSTTDNGDNWDTGVTISGFDYINKMCYDHDLDRIVVAGIETTTLLSIFKYSDDGGNTWHASTMDINLDAEAGSLSTFDMKYCGQGRVVAVGRYNKGNDDPKVLVSIDNAESWDDPFWHATPNGDYAVSIASNSKRFVTVVPDNTGGGGTFRYSLSSL